MTLNMVFSLGRGVCRHDVRDDRRCDESFAARWPRSRPQCKSGPVPCASRRGSRRLSQDIARPGAGRFRQDFGKSVRAARRISPDDIQAAASKAAVSLQNIFANAFKSQGYEIVAGSGPGVPRISPNVVNSTSMLPTVPHPE